MMGEMKELSMIILEELKEYIQAAIDESRAEGNMVDVESHKKYCEKMFILGKIAVLEKRLNDLEGKGNNDTKTKQTTSKKTNR